MSLRFSVTALFMAVVASAAALASGNTVSGNIPASVAVAATTTTATTNATIIGPSGLPVPRFVALKKDEVRARFGPSFDYPVAYEFRRQGLPLKVIAEDRDNIWRRVEDRDGRRMWIHRSMLAPNESAVVMDGVVILRAEPREDSAGRAQISGGVMLKIETCDQGWCRLRTDDFRGWVPAEKLWGATI